MLGLGVGLFAVELENDFRSLDVLFLDGFFFVVLELVGLNVLDRGELGDAADTLGIEDVLGVEVLEGGLLEVVDGGVFEDVAVQIAADELNDGIAKLIAFGVEIDEVELFSDRFQCLGELRAEELVERFRGGSAGAADGLSDFDHIFDALVDAHEEHDFDIGTNVVAADQSVLGAAVDLDRLDRDVHDLRFVDDRQNERAGKRHLGLSLHFVDDECLALLYLAVELGHHHQESPTDDDERYEAHRH